MAAAELLTVASPLEGRVVELAVAAGDRVGAGSMLAIIESMKMHHDVVEMCIRDRRQPVDHQGLLLVGTGGAGPSQPHGVAPLGEDG